VSQENVEIAREMLDAFFRGDLDTVFRIFDPEIEFRPPPESPEFETYRGHDGLNRAFSRWLGAWESIRFGDPEFIDAGDQVFAAHDQWGKSKGTGVEVRNDVFNVFTVRGGKIVRFEDVLRAWRSARSRRLARRMSTARPEPLSRIRPGRSQRRTGTRPDALGPSPTQAGSE
jgi:uncharacterized protein